MPFGLTHLASVPRGSGQTVLVLPGFGASDGSTFVVRAYLRWLGYDVRGWQLGINMGAKTVGLHNERLLQRIDELNDELGGEPLHIIGWSMGGIMARMVARERPQAVALTILLGAPITGNPFANHGWQLYERLTGHLLCHPVTWSKIMESQRPAAVNSVSLYSKSDGVAAWQCCLEPPAKNSRNVTRAWRALRTGFNVKVLQTVAIVLAEELPHSSFAE